MKRKGHLTIYRVSRPLVSVYLINASNPHSECTAVHHFIHRFVSHVYFDYIQFSIILCRFAVGACLSKSQILEFRILNSDTLSER